MIIIGKVLLYLYRPQIRIITKRLFSWIKKKARLNSDVAVSLQSSVAGTVWPIYIWNRFFVKISVLLVAKQLMPFSPWKHPSPLQITCKKMCVISKWLRYVLSKRWSSHTKHSLAWPFFARLLCPRFFAILLSSWSSFQLLYRANQTLVAT